MLYKLQLLYFWENIDYSVGRYKYLENIIWESHILFIIPLKFYFLWSYLILKQKTRIILFPHFKNVLEFSFTS